MKLTTKRLARLMALVTAFGISMTSSPFISAQRGTPDDEWRHYSGNVHGTKY